MSYDVIVIGGGAAGMLAAGSAAERGARVALLERGARLGRKLSITGDGRCNLTNTDCMDDFVRAFGANGRFLYRAFSAFSNRDLVAFFAERGVPVKEEAGGRIFPASDRAESVVAALSEHMALHGVDVRLGRRAERIVVDSESGRVAGVKIAGCGAALDAASAILATGGLSYPATGSTGDGYAMARALGHTIVPPGPALVPLETADRPAASLPGVALSGVAVSAVSGRRRFVSQRGDLIFTHFGLSGPAVLALSGHVVEHLDRGEQVEISLDLVPDLDGPAREDALVRAFAVSGKKLVATVLGAFAPKALARFLLRAGGMPDDARCGRVTAAQRRRLAGLLGDLRFAVKRPRPIAEAIVTRGGIDLREVDPRTMESRRVKGLFFCGEILDVDGASGGYNLQAAFSTARLAAANVPIARRAP